MPHKWRILKEEDQELEQVIEKMVNGVRNKISIVVWRIERSRDVSPEAIKNMFKNCLEALVRAVESDDWYKQWDD
jgi:hypothetical protein